MKQVAVQVLYVSRNRRMYNVVCWYRIGAAVLCNWLNLCQIIGLGNLKILGQIITVFKEWKIFISPAVLSKLADMYSVTDILKGHNHSSGLACSANYDSMLFAVSVSMLRAILWPGDERCLWGWHLSLQWRIIMSYESSMNHQSGESEKKLYWNLKNHDFKIE